MNIRNLKEVIKFGIEFGEGLDKSLEDGKITLMDSLHFIGAMKAIRPAFEDIGEVPKEIAGLDSEGRAELSRYVEQELDISNDKVEMIIEKSFTIAISFHELRELMRSRKRKEDSSN